MRLSRIERARRSVEEMYAVSGRPAQTSLDLNGLVDVLTGRPAFETQREFILSPERVKWYTGPYGSGKTTALAASVILPSLLYPGSSWMVARQTYWTLEETTMEAFTEALNRLGSGIIVDEIKGPPRKIWISSARLGKGGAPCPPSKILFHGLDEIGKLGSTKFSGIAVDEANEISLSMATTLNGRLRFKRPNIELNDGTMLRGEDEAGRPLGPFFLNFCSNPPQRAEWLHQKFCREDDCDLVPMGKKFKSRPNENPYLPKDYYRDTAIGMSSAQILRFIEGECGPNPSPGSAVFGKEFNMALHVGDLKADRRYGMLRGWDFGRRRPAVTWAQRLPNGQVNRLHCLLGDGEHLEKFGRRVLEMSALMFPWCRDWKDFCDPHGNGKRDTSDKSSFDIMRQDLNLFPQWRDTSIETGLGLMSKGLSTLIDGRPRSMFDRNGCARLIEGYSSGYVWPRIREGFAMKEKPLADGFYEHLMDADRYIEVNLNLGSMVPVDQHKRNLRRIISPMTGR